MILDIAVAVGIAVAVILLQRRVRRVEKRVRWNEERNESQRLAIGAIENTLCDVRRQPLTEMERWLRYAEAMERIQRAECGGITEFQRGRPDQAPETATEHAMDAANYLATGVPPVCCDDDRFRCPAAQTADPPPTPLPCTRGPHHGDFPDKGD